MTGTTKAIIGTTWGGAGAIFLVSVTIAIMQGADTSPHAVTLHGAARIIALVLFFGGCFALILNRIGRLSGMWARLRAVEAVVESQQQQLDEPRLARHDSVSTVVKAIGQHIGVLNERVSGLSKEVAAMQDPNVVSIDTVRDLKKIDERLRGDLPEQ